VSHRSGLTATRRRRSRRSAQNRSTGWDSLRPPLRHQTEEKPPLSRRDLIDVALGRTPADTCIEGGVLINVSTAELYEADVAMKGDRIAAVGDVAYTKGPKTRVIDTGGRYVTPGLIETHLHCYHSYLGVNEYVQALLLHGVTATADGFYGQGIVGKAEAVSFFKDAFDATPLRLIFLVPALAYLQNREIGLTPAPGITVDDMFEMLDWSGCRGLEEPPFSPITEKYPEFLDLFEATLARGKVVTGHAAGISERELQAYVAMGAYTDHESGELQDGLLKARAGMKLLMREGSMGRHTAELARAYTERGIDTRALSFSTDLASPEKLVSEGAIDQHIRVAIANGVPPIKAVQMATINAAEVFGLQHDIGSVSPGRYADILIVDNIVQFSIHSVIVGGQTVVEEGELTLELLPIDYPKNFYGSIRLPRKLTPNDLAIRALTEDEVVVRVIGVTDGSFLTRERQASLRPVAGQLAPDLENDVLLLAMADRHGKGTGIGLGFVQGFGLQAGAIGSSVSGISQNLVAVGTNSLDMAVAMNYLAEIGGGMVVVRDGKPVATVELPLLGILSEDPLDVVLEKFASTFACIAELGCSLASPFSQLEFCFAGQTMGELRLSEEGLVRVKDGAAERLNVIAGP
jgi:adenine deaminase